MYKDIIERLLTYPQRGQVQVNFDLNRKKFRLSVPIFTNPRGLPGEIKKYVEARKGCTFEPHITTFQKDQNKVYLVQEIPFSMEFQENLRNKADQFWQMSQMCHKMLSEIAIEDQYKDALFLDSQF